MWNALKSVWWVVVFAIKHKKDLPSLKKEIFEFRESIKRGMEDGSFSKSDALDSARELDDITDRLVELLEK